MSSIDHSQSGPRIMASGSGASEPIPVDADGYKRHSVFDLMSLKGRVTVVTGTYSFKNVTRLGNLQYLTD